MQRAIVIPADLAGSALSELKDWLAITTTREDQALEQLLHASLAMCEGFIRQAPLWQTYEDIHPATSGWQNLSLSPVQSITQVEAVAQDGTRSPLASSLYLVDITFAATGRFRLLNASSADRLAVQYSAGMAADWAGLDPAIRHGIIRLSAHLFRARDNSAESGQPPAAVAALWRPFRRMRMA